MADTYVIIVRAEGDGPPVPIRLRHLLKVMLRRFGVRCLSIEPAQPSPEGSTK